MAYAEDAADGIAILLWAARPEQPELLHTPFFFAAAAAAMETPVEMYFTAQSVRLLQKGVAEQLQAPGHTKNVLQAMQEAASFGVRFLACTDALRAAGLQTGDLLDLCQGHGGAVQFMARAADLRWRTLVF